MTTAISCGKRKQLGIFVALSLSSHHTAVLKRSCAAAQLLLKYHTQYQRHHPSLHASNMAVYTLMQLNGSMTTKPKVEQCNNWAERHDRSAQYPNI